MLVSVTVIEEGVEKTEKVLAATDTAARTSFENKPG
jgi:hypothetical protein